MGQKSIKEVAKTANECIKNGMTVVQTWICEKCGDKVYGDNPNQLYTQGLHSERNDGSPCGHITDLEKTGCGLTSMFGSDTSPEEMEAHWRRAAKVE